MRKLKVLGINGSPRKGNTGIALKTVMDVLDQEGFETEVCQVGGRMLAGCLACGWCSKNKVGRCVQDKDIVNEAIAKAVEADAILLASPVYYADITTEMKAVVDRVGFVTRMNGGLLRRKVGAGIAVARRAGAIHAFDSLNHFFLINEMIIPGSSYWNVLYGLEPGDVDGDMEGIETMKILGVNMAWLLKKIHS